MRTGTTFENVLDASEHLPADQQAGLVDVVRRRLAERGRQQTVADVRDGRAEHAVGQIDVTSVDELMREIQA